MIQINGVKYGKKGVKDSEGNYYPCFYNFGKQQDGQECLTVYARSLIDGLPKSMRPINNSESMTDYFESDRAKFFPGSDVYEAVKGMAH